MNCIFNNQVIDLLTLKFDLIPKDAYKIFDIVRYVFENARKSTYKWNLIFKVFDYK